MDPKIQRKIESKINELEESDNPKFRDIAKRPEYRFYLIAKHNVQEVLFNIITLESSLDRPNWFEEIEINSQKIESDLTKLKKDPKYIKYMISQGLIKELCYRLDLNRTEMNQVL